VVPVSASFRTLRLAFGRADHPFMLESTRADPVSSRWSIFAAEPVSTFVLKNDRVIVTDVGVGSRVHPVEHTRKKGGGGLSFLDHLRSWLFQFRDSDQDRPEIKIPGPFAGGAIGFLSYDLGRSLEHLPNRLPDSELWDDVRLGLYDVFTVYDHKHQRAWLVARDFPGFSTVQAADRIDRWLPLIARAESDDIPRWPGGQVQPILTRAGYIERVERVLDYIGAGDIFQTNFTHRFECRSSGDSLALHDHLATISPAPFAAFSRWGDQALVCSSPEWFYRIEGDKVITRPIKGTRPRGSTPESDAAQRAELLASAKDRAELTMIVDLERNDLGRVCRFGSVRVNQSMVLESYAQVHHLVAEIEGRLRPDRDDLDLLAAMFPGGSITGAPKIRAMQIIEELETHRRGIYTGAVGYIGADGKSAWNIPIRTILKSGETYSFNVGGGIVADSIPAEEYDETMTKALGMRRALETPSP
jgi:para-aminobenzoate synthetase component 1